jgi:hypothetical protein
MTYASPSVSSDGHVPEHSFLLVASRQPMTEGDASGSRPPAAPQYLPCRTAETGEGGSVRLPSHPMQDIMTSAMEFYTLLQFFRPLRIAYPADLIKPFFLFWRAGTTPPMENHRSTGVDSDSTREDKPNCTSPQPPYRAAALHRRAI